MAVSRLSSPMGVDTRQFHAFVSACRKAAPMVSKGLSKDLSAAGEIVAAEARSISGQHSQTIPPTIKVRRRVATVAVQAGSQDVPLAILYEKGNKGSGSNSRTFRHPVFGNSRNWVEEPRYPFLRPAADKTMPAVEALVLKKLDAAVEEIAHGS